MKQPEAAVAIVQAHEPEPAILLIRRAEREGDSWSGHWSFPGGWRQPSDPDMLTAAIREMEEECGVRLAPEQMERALPHTIARRKVGRFVLVEPFLFRVERTFETVLNPQEASGALWVAVSMLRDPESHALRTAPGRPSDMLFPSVDLGGLPLWGFTYRLITDWLGLGSKSESAGQEAADWVLEFLATHGVKPLGAWSIRPDGARSITVDGAIPADEVFAHFANLAPCPPAINCLEVHADHIRVAGPAWEEYFITAA